MRIARFTTGEDPRFGVVEAEGAGEVIAVVQGDPLYTPIQFTGERVPLDDARLLAPVIPRSKVVAVGKNYADHVVEMGGDTPPTEPLLFLKPNTAVVGPGDPIVLPRQSNEVHYEGELAIVIGRAGRHIDARDAGAHIAGYTVASDVTAFDLMFPGHADDPNAMSAALLQQLRGKGHDTFLPLGPSILTADEVADPADLEIVTTVNGEQRQRARAGEMLAGIPRLVAEASAVLALHPGDIILTGTPPGIGLQQDPPVFLRGGDVVEIAIEPIGRLRNALVDELR